MRFRPTDRDDGLRRVSRLTRWLAAGGVALLGVFSGLVASALPGTSGHRERLLAADDPDDPDDQPEPVGHAPDQPGRAERPECHGPQPRAGTAARRVAPPERGQLGRVVTDAWPTVSFPALGTTATLVVTDETVLQEARRVLDAVLAEVDEACSRFREDSELMRVNAHPGEVVPVGPVLRDALDVALRGACLTDGDVDPTVGRAVRVLGYDRDFSSVPAAGDALTCVVARVPGWQAIQIDHDAATAQVPRGVELDLGATAKAFAADRAAAAIVGTFDCAALVSLGGDVAVAGPAPADGWPVRVTDDHAAGPRRPARPWPSPSAGSRPPARRCGGGDAVTRSCTTSSTRAPGGRHPSAGGRSAWSPGRASTPTRPARPRSSAGTLRCPGCASSHCPPVSSAPTAASCAPAAGPNRASRERARGRGALAGLVHRSGRRPRRAGRPDAVHRARHRDVGPMVEPAVAPLRDRAAAPQLHHSSPSR